MPGRFSSITRTSDRPAAKFRTVSGLKGIGMLILSKRIPQASISASERRPSRVNASRTSRYVMPDAMMPIQAWEGSTVIGFSLLTEA